MVFALMFVKGTANKHLVKTSRAVDTKRWTGVFGGPTKSNWSNSLGQEGNDDTGCNRVYENFDGKRLSCRQMS